MRRKDKEISSRESMEKILMDAKIGILGMCIDGLAYMVPVNFVYNDGAIFFHSAQEGKKVDAMKNNSFVSFLVFIEGGIVATKPPCGLTQSYMSVMIEGNALFIEDSIEKRDVLVALNRKYYPHREYLSIDEKTVKDFKAKAGVDVEVVKITICSMSGKSNAWK